MKCCARGIRRSDTFRVAMRSFGRAKRSGEDEIHHLLMCVPTSLKLLACIVLLITLSAATPLAAAEKAITAVPEADAKFAGHSAICRRRCPRSGLSRAPGKISRGGRGALPWLADGDADRSARVWVVG